MAKRVARLADKSDIDSGSRGRVQSIHQGDIRLPSPILDISRSSKVISMLRASRASQRYDYTMIP